MYIKSSTHKILCAWVVKACGGQHFNNVMKQFITNNRKVSLKKPCDFLFLILYSIQFITNRLSVPAASGSRTKQTNIGFGACFVDEV